MHLKNFLKFHENLISFFSFLLLVLPLLFGGCLRYEKPDFVALDDPHFELYSSPHAPNDKIPSYLKRIIVIGTSDLNAQILPQIEFPAEESEDEKMKVGGAALFATYLNVLKKKYPGQVLLAHTGHFSTGSFLADQSQGLSILKVINQLNYDAISLGREDFFYSEPTSPQNKKKSPPQAPLKKLISQSHAPVILTNLLDITTGRPVEWKKARPFHIVEISGLKVGIIGTLAQSTPSKGIKERFQGLYFQNVADAVYKYANLLRNTHQVKAVIWLTQTPIECGLKLARQKGLDLERVNFAPDRSDLCVKEGELYNALSLLPEGTIDAVITAGGKSKVANFIHKTPVIGPFSNGKFFGRIDLYYDTRDQRIDATKTEIFAPTKLCSRFFSQTQDCVGAGKNIDYKKTLEASYLGERVFPDPGISSLIEKEVKRWEKKGQRPALSLPYPLKRKEKEESRLGQMMADALVLETDAHLALVDSSVLGGHDQIGELSHSELYQMGPGQHYATTFNMSGEEILSLAQSSMELFRDERVLHWSDGAKLTFESTTPAQGPNQSSHLKLASFYLNGKQITPNETYLLAVTDQLIASWPRLKSLIDNEKNIRSLRTFYSLSLRSLLGPYLLELAKGTQRSFEKYKDLTRRVVIRPFQESHP